MISKKNLVAIVKELPEKFSVDELIDYVVLLDNIETGIRELDAGKGIPHSVAMKEIRSKYLRKSK